jgi:ABC-type bacteriocin/lantibiotic exporter with double-glycine peptidase domain
METSATPDGRKPHRFSTVTRYLKRYRPYLALGGVAIILTNLLALTIPYITKLIFDLLENGGSSGQILRLVLLSSGRRAVSNITCAESCLPIC